MRWRFWRLKPCDHQWVYGQWAPEGVTLDWGMSLEVSYTRTNHCSRCGLALIESGMLLPFKSWPYRNAQGWPLDEDGKEMEIAPDEPK